MIPDAYFERFDTPKYRNKNPVQRALIRRFIAALHGLFIEAGPVASVLEIGVGEGFISGYLSEKFPSIRFTGADLREDDLERVRRLFPQIRALAASAYDLGPAGGPFDLVLCCEILEHLDTPERALDELVALRPRRVLFSVPHEPFFMLSNLMRGKNLTRLGNDIEHVNHWSVRSFRKLLEPRFVLRELTTSYPWILALAEPR